MTQFANNYMKKLQEISRMQQVAKRNTEQGEHTSLKPTQRVLYKKVKFPWTCDANCKELHEKAS